jgi:hypothetical protein
MAPDAADFYVRYYVGHKGKFGHEFLEFELRPDGKVRRSLVGPAVGRAQEPCAHHPFVGGESLCITSGVLGRILITAPRCVGGWERLLLAGTVRARGAVTDHVPLDGRTWTQLDGGATCADQPSQGSRPVQHGQLPLALARLTRASIVEELPPSEVARSFRQIALLCAERHGFGGSSVEARRLFQPASPTRKETLARTHASDSAMGTILCPPMPAPAGISHALESSGAAQESNISSWMSSGISISIIRPLCLGGKTERERLRSDRGEAGCAFQLRYANNSNYKNDSLIRKETFVTAAFMEEVKRIIEDSEVRLEMIPPMRSRGTSPMPSQ